MKLVLPDVQYFESFIQMAENLEKDGHWYDDPTGVLRQNFSNYIDKLIDARNGNNLAVGAVPNTEFWMLEENIVVGRLRLNHHLNDSLKTRGGHIGFGVSSHFRGKGFATEALRQALKVAKIYGLTEVLVTCDTTNSSSIRVIEANSGQLIDEVMIPGRNIKTRRYRILCF